MKLRKISVKDRFELGSKLIIIVFVIILCFSASKQQFKKTKHTLDEFSCEEIYNMSTAEPDKIDFKMNGTSFTPQKVIVYYIENCVMQNQTLYSFE